MASENLIMRSARKSRDKLKARLDATIPSLLEPGEQRVVSLYGKSGPNPVWFGPILFGPWYFIELTDRRVLFIKASLRARSKGLAWADPREAVKVHDLHLSHRQWSHVRYCRPDGKEIRLNFQMNWREELQAFADELTNQPTPRAPEPPAAMSQPTERQAGVRSEPPVHT